MALKQLSSLGGEFTLDAPASASNRTVTLPDATCTLAKTTGVTDGSSAAAGEIGEYTISTGTAVTVANNTATNVHSISLTAGDWDVQGTIQWGTTGAITQLSSLESSVSTTSAARGSPSFNHQTQSTAAWNSASSGGYNHNTPVTRVSVSSTTTVYLVGFSYHTAGSFLLQGTGTIRARRVR